MEEIYIKKKKRDIKSNKNKDLRKSTYNISLSMVSFVNPKNKVMTWTFDFFLRPVSYLLDLAA